MSPPPRASPGSRPSSMKIEYKDSFQIEIIEELADTMYWAEIVSLKTSCLCHEIGPFHLKEHALREAKKWCDKACNEPHTK